MKTSPFAVAFLFTIAGVFLQIKSPMLFGRPIDAALGVLIGVTGFVSFSEACFLILCAAALLRFDPSISSDLFAFALVPVVFFFIRRALPWHTTANTVVAIMGAVVAFYLVTVPSIALGHLDTLLFDAVVSAVCGATAFEALRATYPAHNAPPRFK